MKAQVPVLLHTREVYQLFERKIKGDRLFMEAVLHKINKVLHYCGQEHAASKALLASFSEELLALTEMFKLESGKFEALLAKKKALDNKPISYAVQFKPCISVSNALSLSLIECLEAYDKLIAVLKFLKIAGCFDTEASFFNIFKSYQKKVNQLLGKLVMCSLLKPDNE